MLRPIFAVSDLQSSYAPLSSSTALDQSSSGLPVPAFTLSPVLMCELCDFAMAWFFALFVRNIFGTSFPSRIFFRVLCRSCRRYRFSERKYCRTIGVAQHAWYLRYCEIYSQNQSRNIIVPSTIDLMFVFGCLREGTNADALLL